MIETINPATEEVICSVHSADESDVNAAVDAANKCFNDVWRKVAPAEKGRLVNKLADLMERDKEELAALDALDNGKAYTVARDIDITESIGCFRYFAGWADKIHGKFKNVSNIEEGKRNICSWIPTHIFFSFSKIGKTIDTVADRWCYTRHEALGVVGAVIPWVKKFTLFLLYHLMK